MKLAYKILFFISVSFICLSLFVPVIMIPFLGELLYLITFCVIFTFPILLIIGIGVRYAKK